MKSPYFSHDFDSRTDIKIRNLIRKHGMTGYGIYWAIVEDLYRNANAMRTHYDLYAFEMRVEEDVVRSIVEDFGLFKINGDTFSSDSVERRISEINDRSNKAATSAKARWNKEESERNANGMRSQSESMLIKNKNKNKNNTHTIEPGDFEKSEIFNTIQKNNPELPPKDVLLEVDKFCAHFKLRGWAASDGTIINDFAAAAETWTVLKPKIKIQNGNTNGSRRRDVSLTEVAAELLEGL